MGRRYTWDHPRRCGENRLQLKTDFILLGSPPQVRGKLTDTEIAVGRRRITPAGAGKTSSYSICSFVAAGSPPQVRGKRIVQRENVFQHRITPAGAGKTLFVEFPDGELKDHPRRCGENVLLFRPQAQELGSPPQVRGKPIAIYLRSAKRRITPAGAGKTSKNCGSYRQGKDHPRRCGENRLDSVL